MMLINEAKEFGLPLRPNTPSHIFVGGNLALASH